MSTIRTLLLVFSAIGTVLFGAAFFTSLLDVGYVEAIAKDIIRHQVEKKVHEKIDALDDKFLSTKAGALIKKHAEEAEAVRRQLKEKIPERISAVIAEMRNLDCECRNKIENYLRDGFESHIARAFQAQERLTSLIQTKYMEGPSDLRFEAIAKAILDFLSTFAVKVTHFCYDGGNSLRNLFFELPPRSFSLFSVFLDQGASFG